MNITLIGMPGAGKSYMGKILAEWMKYSFIDTDILLENKFGMKLQKIIDDIGIEKFIKEEANIILELQNIDSTVLSPGGSIIYSSAAMDHLKKISNIVFLNVPLEMIKPRITETSRGIVGIKEKTFEELFNERLPLYLKYADFVVDDNEQKTADDIVTEIRSAFAI
jgi:shikimate kinase